MASVVVAAWSGALGVVAAWAGIQTRKRRAYDVVLPPDLGPSPTLLLRPCAGSEPHLERALRSSSLAHPRVHTRFLVAHLADGAVPAIRRVVAELLAEGRNARLVVTGASAPNMKAAQLARALELDAGRAAIVIVADSDVELSSAVLTSLLAPLASGEADAAWVPPVETCAVTRADRASASVLDASLHSFPLLAALDRRGMVGKLFAVRRDALDAAGGFGSLVDHLGEDVELSRRLRLRGSRVHACTATVGSLATGRSWGEVVHRYARWMAVVRGQRRPLLASYPLLLAAMPLILALAFVATVREGASGVGALVFALGVRFGIAVLARLRTGRRVRAGRVLFEGLVADGVLLVAFGRAVACRALVWRGARLELARNGLVERALERAP